MEQQQLLASDGVGGDSFGVSVSMNSNGSTVLIGASRKTVLYPRPGAAYLFSKNAFTNAWQEDGIWCSTMDK